MTRAKQMIGVALVLMAGFGVTTASVRKEAGPALTRLPSGYRDWRLISVAHEEGKQNDIRAILGNGIAYQAARDGKLPYPDGAIIARLAWRYVPSERNNIAFGKAQSFVAGEPTNVQFMVKDSAQYAATGGWSYVQFDAGIRGEPAAFGACFSCHLPMKDSDYVFNHYSP